MSFATQKLVQLVDGADQYHQEMSMEQKQWPATISEAVGVVLIALSDEDKARIASMSKDELIGLHFGLGMWIRNNLGLWQGNSSLMQAIRANSPGIHPDDVSMVIIEALWDRLQEMTPKVH